MARALQLARLGLYSAHPNPRVGCVIVSDDEVVGEGWHRKSGESHAEIIALEAAGSRAKNSTAYVTLEPCSHEGKTPPCADALIAAGLASVVVAMEDPNPKVSGEGLASMRDAGIDVRTGLMSAAAKALNEGFVSRTTRGRPFVRVKVAASLDGKTAMADGESQWITGEASRLDAQRLRASSGAVMTGVNTVLDDDPSLNVRDTDLDTNGVQPTRVILDSVLRTPADARLLGLDGETIIYCVDDTNKQPFEAAGAAVVTVPARSDRPDVAAVLSDLAAREINDILVEAGPTLSGSLLSQGLADELVIYQAPHIMGSETRGMFETPELVRLGQRAELRVTDMRKIGADVRITARPVNG